MFIMRMHKFIIEIVGNHLSQQDGLPQHPTCIGSTHSHLYVRLSVRPSDWRNEHLFHLRLTITTICIRLNGQCVRKIIRPRGPCNLMRTDWRMDRWTDGQTHRLVGNRTYRTPVLNAALSCFLMRYGNALVALR